MIFSKWGALFRSRDGKMQGCKQCPWASSVSVPFHILVWEVFRKTCIISAGNFGLSVLVRFLDSIGRKGKLDPGVMGLYPFLCLWFSPASLPLDHVHGWVSLLFWNQKGLPHVLFFFNLTSKSEESPQYLSLLCKDRMRLWFKSPKRSVHRSGEQDDDKYVADSWGT